MFCQPCSMLAGRHGCSAAVFTLQTFLAHTLTTRCTSRKVYSKHNQLTAHGSACQVL